MFDKISSKILVNNFLTFLAGISRINQQNLTVAQETKEITLTEKIDQS